MNILNCVPRISHMTIKKRYRVRRYLIPLLVGMVWLPWGLSSQAQIACSTPSFSAPTHFETGLFASGIAVGDYNQDGIPDLAVTNQNANNVSILFGDGKGSFGAKTDFPVAGPPQRIAEGDFNRDGKLDLALPIQALNVVSILLGDGNGGFGTPNDIAVVGGPFMIVVDELNLDGKADLAVTTLTAGFRQVAVLLGDGSGGFSAPTYYGGPSFGNNPNALGVGDFNLDGKPDLAVGGGINMPAATNNGSILLGDGMGGFGEPTYITIGGGPQSMSIADFNRDGVLDIAVSNALGANAPSTVSVLLGDGMGGFGERTAYPIGIAARGTGVADFNQDGTLDLVVANTNAASNSVSVLLGDGNGGFGEKTDFPVGDGPRKITVGDFNLDGKPDIATPNTRSNNVTILLNTCAP